MPVAIANSLSPFDVPDSRSLRPSSSSSSSSPSSSSSASATQAAQVDSRRFVEALNEAQREPSRTIERKSLPPVDEPLDLVSYADDIELRAAQAASPPPDTSSSSSDSSFLSSSASAVDSPWSHVAFEDHQPSKAEPKAAERVRRRGSESSSSSSSSLVSSSLATSAAAKLAIRSAGSDALLQAVQHHVRVSVQNEARQGTHSDERAAKLQAVSTAAFTVLSAELPVEVQPPLNVQASSSSSPSSPSSSMPEAMPMSMAPRESAALEHVQALLDDPASQLFFDGRRAVLTIDGMTMRITSTADGQALVEMTAADAGAAARLHAHRAELVEGLQQEGIALTKLEVSHEAGASTSGDRRRENPEPVEFTEVPRKAVTGSTLPSSPTAPTLRAGVIKA